MGFCNLVPGVIKIIDTPGNLLSIFIIVDQRYLGPFSGVDHIAVDRDWYLGLRVYFRNALAGQQHNIINIRVSYIKAGLGFCNLVPGVIKIIDTPGNLLSIFIIVDQRYLGPFSGVDHIAVDRDWYLGLRVYFRNALAGQQHNIINIRVNISL